MDKVKVGIYGVGYIGRLLAKELLRRGYEIVVAIDVDPNKVGKDLGELIGCDKIGVKISNKPKLELTKNKPDVVLHATGSYLNQVYEQIATIVKCKANVISTCETLAFPYYRYPSLARSLDELARRNSVRILGSGVNPGFIFDSLIILLTAVCSEVKYIHAVRSLDASKRRISFIKKIGVGLSPKEFHDKLKKGEITGHVGYAESMFLIANALNIMLDNIEERQEPIITEQEVSFKNFKIEKGKVIGLRGTSVGYKDNREIIKLEFIAYLGAKDYEKIVIDGTPSMEWVNNKGIHGDIATVSMLVNLIPTIFKLEPGLRTMNDVILVSYKQSL